MNQIMNFGLIIKKLVKQQKITTAEAATMLGYDSRQGLERIYRSEDVSTSILKKACEAFGVDMSYFLTNNRYEVNQSGAFNVVGDPKNSFNKSKSTIGQIIPDNELIVLRTENEGLRNQIEGLKNLIESQKDIIELLKSR